MSSYESGTLLRTLVTICTYTRNPRYGNLWEPLKAEEMGPNLKANELVMVITDFPENDGRYACALVIHKHGIHWAMKEYMSHILRKIP